MTRAVRLLVAVAVALATTGSIRLVLVGSRGERLPLASVDDPATGHFEVVVAVPADAAAGTWRLQARTGSSLLAEHEVRVLAGSVEAGVGEQADQAEPVVAPSGAALGAIRPDAASLATRPLRDPAPSPPWLWAALVAGGVAVLGAGAGATAATRRRRA